MSRFPCEVCGGPTKIRTSKTLTPGFRTVYLQCKDSACGKRFKVDDIKESLTDEQKIERLGIERLDLSTSALVIVDQQRCMANRGLENRNNHDAEALIRALLATWRSRNLPTVHVRHISRDPSSGFAPGQSGAEFQPDFEPQSHEAVFEKNVPDAFIHSGLERWLRARALRHVVVCGVASENSIEDTARSAGNLGFDVWVPESACYTFAKHDYVGTSRTAEEVHAMAMANLAGEYASVVSREWLELALRHWRVT